MHARSRVASVPGSAASIGVRHDTLDLLKRLDTTLVPNLLHACYMHFSWS